jgi:insertion element IS1 protein InsB
MYDRMEFEEVPHVYVDHYESYKEFFPAGNLPQSKRYTLPIERNNGRQRHWLAAFRRRSVVVTKSIENLEKTMALFARFRINGSIDELITLLK